jgi:hypothetical protein
MRKAIKLILIAGLTIVAIVGLLSKPVISQPCQQECPSSQINPDLVHGMRVFGDKQIYITHKPFLNTPSKAHNFQAIYQVDLIGLNDQNPQAIYLSDRQKDTLKEYTLMPTEGFTKTKLLNGSIKSFKGQIYRGDIEECLRKNSRGTKFCPLPLISNNPEVEVKIERAIFVCDFASPDCIPKVPLSKAEYILFGDDSEQYVAHRITGAPDGDFDRILRVDPPIELTQEQLAKLEQNNYLQLIATKDGSNTRETALKSRSPVAFLIDDQGKPVNLEMNKETEYYLEIDPNIF